MAGSVVAIMLNRPGLLGSVLLGSCNFGEAVLLAWLLSRWIGESFAFGDLRSVLGFLAATASRPRPVVLAVPRYWPLPRRRIRRLANMASVARGWDRGGRAALDRARSDQAPSAVSGRTAEALAALTILALASLYAVCQPTGSWLTFSAAVVMFPPLLWLAARHQPPFAIAGASLASSMVICATTFGLGRFGDAAVPIMDRVHGAQAIVMTLMISTLVLTALFAELKLSNELLRIKEASFRRLLGALPAAIHTTDTAGRIMFYNKAAADLWGVAPELGKDKCSDLGRLYYPDGTLVPPDECPTRLCLAEKRAMEGREALFERPDGTRIPIVPYPAPLTDEDGEIVGVVSMKIDITERKQAAAGFGRAQRAARACTEWRRAWALTPTTSSQEPYGSPAPAPRCTAAHERATWNSLPSNGGRACTETICSVCAPKTSVRSRNGVANSSASFALSCPAEKSDGLRLGASLPTTTPVVQSA